MQVEDPGGQESRAIEKKKRKTKPNLEKQELTKK